MKKFRFVIYLPLSILVGFFLVNLLSCSKTKELAAFDVTCNLPKIYFNYPPAGLKATEVTLYSGKIKIPLDSILSANHIPSGIIGSAYLSKMAMIITNPPEATFNWLDSVRMLGSLDSTFLQPSELGSATGIDPNAKTVNLTMNNVDLRPLIYRDTYYLRILVTPSGLVPASAVNMYLDSQIKLHIEPL
jgi:hypothetical protein